MLYIILYPYPLVQSNYIHKHWQSSLFFYSIVMENNQGMDFIAFLLRYHLLKASYF